MSWRWFSLYGGDQSLRQEDPGPSTRAFFERLHNAACPQPALNKNSDSLRYDDLNFNDQAGELKPPATTARSRQYWLHYMGAGGI